MINKPVHLNKYFDKIQAKIKEINDDPKWRDKIMDYETKLLERQQDGEEQGLKKGSITGIKKAIKMLKSLGTPNYKILQQLELNYSDNFSKDDLERFMKEV